MTADIRLTQYASGGGGACKIPPGELGGSGGRLHGRIFEASPDPGAQAIKQFNEHVLHDDRVELVMLAVGDGLTLARAR
jgi:caffeoyl-CoA O-methyltransferase